MKVSKRGFTKYHKVNENNKHIKISEGGDHILRYHLKIFLIEKGNKKSGFFFKGNFG